MRADTTQCQRPKRQHETPWYAAGSADTSASVSPDSTVSSAGGKENAPAGGPDQASAQDARPLVMRVGGGYSILPPLVATPRQGTTVTAPEEAAEAHAAGSLARGGADALCEEAEGQQAPANAAAGDSEQAEAGAPQGVQAGREPGAAPPEEDAAACAAAAGSGGAAGEGAKTGASADGPAGHGPGSGGQDDSAPHEGRAATAAQVCEREGPR